MWLLICSQDGLRFYISAFTPPEVSNTAKQLQVSREVKAPENTAEYGPGDLMSQPRSSEALCSLSSSPGQE